MKRRNFQVRAGGRCAGVAIIGLMALAVGCGGGGGSGRQSVPAVNAVADTASTSPSTAVTIDVLANDTTASGTKLLAGFDSSSANGTIVRDDNGTAGDTSDDKLVYTPNGGFTGEDTFDYTLDDGSGATDEATVTVAVTEATFATDDFATVATDSADNEIDVLANDAAGMVVTSVDTSQTQAGATVTVGTDGANVIYTPPAGYEGPDQFQYTAERDVGGSIESDTATVTITVENTPEPTNVCAPDPEQRLNAGQGYCYEVEITTTNGVLIEMTVFVPHPDTLKANAEATLGAPLPADDPGFAPLLIHSHGFGGRKQDDLSSPGQYLDNQIAKSAWESGYFVISYTQRGFGSSGGQIGMMAPRKEGYDFVDVVNWANGHLRENFQFDVRDVDNVAYDSGDATHTDPSATPDAAWGRSLLMTDSHARVTSADASLPGGDIALGTIGYSYGGGFQFNAQSVDSRVDAIMPMGTWFDLRYSLHPNDSPKTTWITIMTAFATEGGNGEPLPPTIADGNSEANGANAQAADQPHNKPRQVSMRTAKKLGPNGTVGYCDGGELLDPDPGFVPLADESEPDAVVPPNALQDRAMRAHLFMIQGYQDTLFNFNEGYDNARCFEDQGADGLDVRLLEQTSGHPLPPPVGPDHYAGSTSSMYLDEIVHCGVDDGAPKKYAMRETGMAWFDYHLRGLLPGGATGVDDIFPRVCITQVNTNTDLKLKVGAENPEFSGTNDSSEAHAFSREGATFDSVAAVPRGCTGAGADCAAIDIETVNEGAFTVTTGPDPTQQKPADFLPLYTATDTRVMAGLPLVDWQVTRANPSQDEVFLVGVGIARCHANSADGDGSGTDCEGNSADLLHYQVAPVRVFPTAAADLAAMQPPTATAPFPKDDPRSQPGAGNPAHYPIRWGDNPGFASSTDTAKGRLVGVSARLFPGDVVGLMFYGEHPVLKSLSSSAPGQVTITGTVELPLLDASPAPSFVPAYVEDASAP